MTETEAATATASLPARLGERLLASLLAMAEQRALTAMVAMHEAQLSVVVFPELAAGVAIVERGDEAPEALRGRLETLLRAHDRGVLHLVLTGGSDADVPLLRAADREAPDPNRLGVHLLDVRGHLRRIAGRRFGLLGTATRAIARTPVLSSAALTAQLEVHNDRAQKRRIEAAVFATALDKRPHHATRILGGVSIVMFALAFQWGTRGGFNRALIAMGANHRYLVEDGEVFRLLAHAFLHGNTTHLIVNLIGLFSFGGFLESLLGWRRIVILYGASALLGGVFSAFIGHAHLSVGASGAIWGFMAAGIGIVLRRGTLLPPFVAARLRPRLFWVLALNTALSIAPLFIAGFPRIDLWAHLGGGLMGFALTATGLLTRGLAAGVNPTDLKANPVWLRVLAIGMAVLMAVSVASALWTGKPWDLRVLTTPDEMA